MKIWIVDTFTSQPFRGNPAGVCILMGDEEISAVAGFPSTKAMQNIAMELNLSETAFVHNLGEHHYHIRWFTPNSEAPLCGHATIAALHILIQENIESENQVVLFESLAGTLKAIKKNNQITLNFPAYPTKPLRLSADLLSIVQFLPNYTATSENCILMEFEVPDMILDLEPDLKLLSKLPYRALIVTARPNLDKFSEYDFILRYFAPRVGINEDQVCASAHCRLTPYWAAKLAKNDLISYQASKRGGVIHSQDLGERVLISGDAVTVLEGRINT